MNKKERWNKTKLDVLLAAIELERFRYFELHDKAGYDKTNVSIIVARYKRLGLIEKIAGLLQVTEKGKIAAAIMVGQMRKRIVGKKEKVK